MTSAIAGLQSATSNRRYWICRIEYPIELLLLTPPVVSVSLDTLLALFNSSLVNWEAQHQVPSSEGDPPVSEAGVYSHQALLTPSFSITGYDLQDFPFRIIHIIHLVRLIHFVVCGFPISPISPQFSTETGTHQS